MKFIDCVWFVMDLDIIHKLLFISHIILSVHFFTMNHLLLISASHFLYQTKNLQPSWDVHQCEYVLETLLFVWLYTPYCLIRLLQSVCMILCGCHIYELKDAKKVSHLEKISPMVSSIKMVWMRLFIKYLMKQTVLKWNITGYKWHLYKRPNSHNPKINLSTSFQMFFFLKKIYLFKLAFVSAFSCLIIV